MTSYLVTVCNGEVYTHGPACIVEAESVPEAASFGVQRLADEERGASSAYGIECEGCEHIVVERVTVFEMSDGKLFGSHLMWGPLDG